MTCIRVFEYTQTCGKVLF